MRLLTALVLLAAGVLFTASALNARVLDDRAARPLALRDLVSRQAAEVAQVQERLAREQQALATDQRNAADGRVRLVLRQAALLAEAAGSTEVTGPGLTVVLDDAADVNPAGTTNPNDLIIHQEDVQAVVNGLWRGGARAMTIMGQRVISTSAVRCVGNTLLLQGRVYSPPFVISAIGDPLALQASLAEDPGVMLFAQYAKIFGLGYSVTPSESLVAPAYNGPRTLRVARPRPVGVS